MLQKERLRRSGHLPRLTYGDISRAYAITAENLSDVVVEVLVIVTSPIPTLHGVNRSLDPKASRGKIQATPGGRWGVDPDHQETNEAAVSELAQEAVLS